MLSLPGLRRAKETFGGPAELAPLRLIGGFVCVDSHLGCAGCHFCLNRRYPLQAEVLERRLHRNWADAGLSPERLAALVAALPAVRRGRVPVRFGHASDLAYQVDGARALLAALPGDRPALLLTRFPPGREAVALVAAHPNSLLHLSVTPTVPGVMDSDEAPGAVLQAAAAVPPRQLYVMLVPLVAGSEAASVRILEAIPPGAAVGFKPLSSAGIPFIGPATPLGPQSVAALTTRARGLGLQVPPMAGCQVRANLGLPFFRHREIVAERPGACAGCPNLATCAGVPPPSDAAIHAELAVLGLAPSPVRRGPGGLEVAVDVPVCRADEVYLSEALGLPVFLSGVWRGGEFAVVEVGSPVLDRWDAAGFYPAAELYAAARRMAVLTGLVL